jgi:hypothetical protein
MSGWNIIKFTSNLIYATIPILIELTVNGSAKAAKYRRAPLRCISVYYSACHCNTHSHYSIFKISNMGRKSDLNTSAQYQIFQTYTGYKNGAATCRHYAKTGTRNIARMKLHLTECQPYQRFLITQTAERDAKKRRLESGEDNLI